MLVSLIFVTTPLATAAQNIEGLSLSMNLGYAQQSAAIEEKQEPLLRTGYLLLVVLVYTPGQSLTEYKGANITARSLFHKYNGTTDDNGVCMIKVSAPFLHERVFFVKASIVNKDGNTRSRIALISMKAWHLAYRIFLFANI